LTYAESDDGVHWVRPMLDLVPYTGRPGKTNVEYAEQTCSTPQTPGTILCEKTNILLDHTSGGTCSFTSVFINTDAPIEKRYEILMFREPMFDGPRSDGVPYVKGLNATKQKDTKWLCRYYSEDGMHWVAHDGPIDIETNDSCWIYKELASVTGHQYVCHHKLEVQGELPTGFVAQLPPYEIACYSPEKNDNCRVQWRRTSDDGIHWSDRQLVLAPDPVDPPDTQFHELTVFPYSDRGLIGMVATEHANEQTLTQYFAASADGTDWWRPSRRRPCVPLTPLGDYGSGSVYPMRMMVEEDDKMHLYYSGLANQQNNLYETKSGCHPFNGAIMRSTWKTGRFWAAVTSQGGPSEGQLLTHSQNDVVGKSLVVNAVTVGDGQLQAELLDAEGNVIAGYSRDDCQLLRGDQLNATVQWTGGDKCPADTVAVRVYFNRTRLYGFQWR
jgi:hypothetical protein